MPRVVHARTVAQHRRQVLDRVYRSFEALVCERGYDAVSLADVAKAAAMARTAIYHYFPDKESLLLAYTAREVDEHFSDLRSELHRIDDPLDRLDAYVRAQLTFASTHRLPPGPGLRPVLSEEGFRTLSTDAEILEVTLAAILDEAAAEELIPAEVADDPHTVPLVLGCIAATRVRDQHGEALDGEALDAAITSTQAFVGRAVGASAAGPRR